MSQADVFVDGRRVYRTEFEDGQLWDHLVVTGFKLPPDVKRRTCPHQERNTAYAYVNGLNRHWPIEFCAACLAITRGRHAFRPEGPHKPASNVTAEDVILSKWYRVWPKHGRPRGTKMPVIGDWPDTY